MGKIIKRSVMTRLIDDLELEVLRTPASQRNVSVSGEDLLILIAYARECEAVILMMDDNPDRAKELFGF
jgi:hypothetical protein